jgi:hypothetical protein
MIFCEMDLSQAESRAVYVLTGDKRLWELAQLRSDEYDGHTENVKLIFEMSDPQLKALSKEEFKRRRFVGKKVSHGAQRGMEGPRLSDTILKDLGMLVPPATCTKYLEKYHANLPAIRGSYFYEIRRLMMRDKCLVNSWGRVLDFRYDRFDEELFRQGYSFPPQSEVADLVNEWGLMPLYYYMKSAFGYPPNLQGHDSLLASVPAVYAYDIAELLVASLERPRLLWGRPLTIPCEFKLGSDWGGQHEFKRLPSRDEFTDVALALERGTYHEG